MSVSQGLLYFALFTVEVSLYRVFRSSNAKIAEVIEDAYASYKVPPEVSADIFKQITSNISVDELRTFFLDLFEAKDVMEIKIGNMETFCQNTMCLSQDVTKEAISKIEASLNIVFEEGHNLSLQHAFSRDDGIIRSRYVPSIIKLPLLALKFSLDLATTRYYKYKKFGTTHVDFYTRENLSSKPYNKEGSRKRIFFFLCGIGVGMCMYRRFIDAIAESEEYDMVVGVEIKMISYHLSVVPARDSDIINALLAYLEQLNCSTKNIIDLGCHSGGALYVKRLISRFVFRHTFLIEPACFLAGCTTGTNQIYSYQTLNPIFQEPLIKNLMKVLDIAETILNTYTPLVNCHAILSQHDTLFIPEAIISFLSCYFPLVDIRIIPNSGHGGAIGLFYQDTAQIIVNILQNNIGKLSRNSSSLLDLLQASLVEFHPIKSIISVLVYYNF